MNTTELNAPDSDCPYCNGTGEADSGGIHPWGEPATIPCRCMYEDPFHVHVSAYNNLAAQLEDAQGEIRELRDRLVKVEAEHEALKKAISDAVPVAWLHKRDMGALTANEKWLARDNMRPFADACDIPLYTLEGIRTKP